MKKIPDKILLGRTHNMALDAAQTVNRLIDYLHEKEKVKSILPEKLSVDSCMWAIEEGDKDQNKWTTECGDIFMLMVDGPLQNGMKFCPYCGKTLVEFER